ncbi:MULTISPECIES: hypothetical protein [Pseudofrankia]|uniref:hypothetical protein n=1 Tax=Pseudofrankia TaxID=2994363 RepID=UPI000234CE84|nr:MULTISPECIES: hypothetical protein [Pseudofrankia]OHV36388.1 hypothetical protein BCD49_19210 [Pseudofrankia sp. EUN1h]
MAEQLVPPGADAPDFQADPDTHAVPGAPDVAGSRGAVGSRRTEPRRTEPRRAGQTRGGTGPGTPRAGEAEGGRQGRDPDHRVQVAKAAWRAAAAATADPRWARPGTSVAWPGWDAVYPESGASARAAASGPVDAGSRPAATARTRPGWWSRGWAALVLPAALATAGALLTVISSTMTWATVRAFGLMEYSVAGLDAGQHGRLTLGLGILTGLAAAGLAARPGGHAGRLVAGLSGVTGLATTLVALIDIGYLRGGGLLAGSGIEATTVIGPGLWLVLVGGLLAIAAALLARPGPGRGRWRGPREDGHGDGRGGSWLWPPDDDPR